MNPVLVGLSHRSAPVAIRERYSIAPARVTALDEKIVQRPGIDEAVLVSTCNRTEIVAVARDPDAALDDLCAFLHGEIGDGSAAPEQIYAYRDADVAMHVFEVAASLDSMVLGEAQILGQLKASYRSAIPAHSCGPVLHRLFQRAFGAAKRIRTHTGLGASAVSVARVGVGLAREIFEDLSGKRALLIGAGEMAESALVGLRDAGVREFVIANRTLSTAAALAQSFDGRAVDLDGLGAELCEAHIVVCSVQVDRPLLGLEELRPVARARHGRPLLMVDLGIPRNIDPQTRSLPGIYGYDLDDIEHLAERGRAARSRAIAPAREIVRAEAERFERWRAALPYVPTIRQLRERVYALARAEVAQGGEGASGPANEALLRTADTIAARLLHQPLERLRAEAEQGTGSYYADAVRALFGLEEDGD